MKQRIGKNNAKPFKRLKGALSMLLNIHGFDGHCWNTKYEFLKKNFPEENIVSLQLDYAAESPDEVMERLRKAIAENQRPEESLRIVGSSLGGFFAYCLNASYGAAAVLINPSLLPFITLKGFHDVDTELCRWYAEFMAEYLYKADLSKITALLAEDDELLDHSYTRVILSGARLYTITGGHRPEITGETARLLRESLRP